MLHDRICIICGTIVDGGQIDLPNDFTQAQITNATVAYVHGDDALHAGQSKFCYVTMRENQVALNEAEELAEAERLREMLGL